MLHYCTPTLKHRPVATNLLTNLLLVECAFSLVTSKYSAILTIFNKKVVQGSSRSVSSLLC